MIDDNEAKTARYPTAGMRLDGMHSAAGSTILANFKDIWTLMGPAGTSTRTVLYCTSTPARHVHVPGMYERARERKRIEREKKEGKKAIRYNNIRI